LINQTLANQKLISHVCPSDDMIGKKSTFVVFLIPYSINVEVIHELHSQTRTFVLRLNKAWLTSSTKESATYDSQKNKELENFMLVVFFQQTLTEICL
jgi:hypothetical protein